MYIYENVDYEFVSNSPVMPCISCSFSYVASSRIAALLRGSTLQKSFKTTCMDTLR